MSHAATSHAPSSAAWTVWPFALTIFVSAFLLFQVQPLLSKQILPWFGGSPAVWTTAMLFFQTLLCLGYLYAHGMSRLASRRLQAGIHGLLLLVCAVLSARVLPGLDLRPQTPDAPVAQVLTILGASVGLPYFCLATTGPLVQHWFTRTAHAHSVFRLYALSNVGSFLALLSFPYVLEPWLDLQQMAQLWTGGFVLFVLLCLPVALGLGQQAQPLRDDPGSAPVPGTVATVRPGWMRRLSWVTLPALASLVFITATDQISHNIAPEPRLWISTLSLYLLTFIFTFDNPRWYHPRLVALLCLLMMTATAGMADIPGWLGLEWDYGVHEVRWLHYGLIFVVCLLCHGELYRRRPEDPTHLTEFYLCMSVGGAFGGLFVALVATNWFDDYHEWLMALVAAALLASAVLFRRGPADHTAVPPATALSGVVGRSVGPLQFAGVCVATGMVALLVTLQNPWSWRQVQTPAYSSTLLDQARNFYGTVSVSEWRYTQQPELDERIFSSGSVTHGQQFLSTELRHVPGTYYARDSGIGESLQWAMSRKQSLSVALIGLGAGTLANYARETDRYDFFEINPEAVRIAERWFDNLAACKAREKNILLGDARLRLEQLPSGQRYDVIVLDAFTGGSVPIHLLTREAFAIYRDHLAPDGHLAINITNAYLHLYPVVKAQAQHLGMGFRHKHQEGDEARHVRRNLHFIMTSDRAYLDAYPSVDGRISDEAGKVLRIEPLDIPGLRLWTDQFSSIAPIAR